MFVPIGVIVVALLVMVAQFVGVFLAYRMGGGTRRVFRGAAMCPMCRWEVGMRGDNDWWCFSCGTSWETAAVTEVDDG